MAGRPGDAGPQSGAPGHLQALVEAPRESLEVEVKQWLDLTRDNVGRATLAKEVLALANHGGGVVLLGVTEHGDGWRAAGPCPFDLEGYTADAINAIVTKYADPKFEVATHHLHDRAGNLVVVVDVPGGHRVPVRSCAAGPDGHALRQNTYYTRRPGPQSAPIADSNEWDAVIARCVRAQRDTLADMFREIARTMGGGEALLGAVTPAPADPGPQERLAALEALARRRLDELVAPLDGPAEQSRFRHGIYACGYEIEQVSHPPSLAALKRILLDVQGRETGWPMWIVPSGRMPETIEAYDGMLECFLNDDEVFADAAHSDFWLAHPAGRAMLLRGHQDDSKAEGVRPAGKLLDLTIPIWRAGELARHAHRLAQRLGGEATPVHLRMTWTGLQGRQLSDWASEGRMIGPFYTSMDDEATGTFTIESEAIPNTLPEIAEALVSPLYAAFDYEPEGSIFAQEISHLLRRG